MKRLLLAVLAVLLLFSAFGCDNAPQNVPNETVEINQDISLSNKEETVDYNLEITKDLVQSIINADYEKPKNVIVLIGDGMGPNDITIAEKYADWAYDFGLILNQITHSGFAKTRSADDEVTDSAASATALSTGVRTNNGYIGKDIDGKNLKTMAERAREAGKKVGIVTDDLLYGATPGAFVTHSIDRYNYDEISEGILDFAPEVMIGSSFEKYCENLSAAYKSELRKKYNIASELSMFDKTFDDCKENEKFFAGFNGGYTDVVSDHLARSAEIALKLLENDNGFFLMIESCGTDMHGHNNNIEGKMASVVNLDKTLAKLLLFMQKNPDTLLIVTSDHETGGVKLPKDNELPTDELFTKTSHTSTDVRVFAVGKGSEYFNGKTVENTDIANFVIDALNGK